MTNRFGDGINRLFSTSALRTEDSRIISSHSQVRPEQSSGPWSSATWSETHENQTQTSSEMLLKQVETMYIMVLLRVIVVFPMGESM